MKNLPRNPAVNGTPASDAIAISMAKARKGERFARPLKSSMFSPVCLATTIEDGEAQQRHEQIGDEIKRDGLASERHDADEQIARVGDARVSEQPLQIALRKRRQISVNQGEQRDADKQALASAAG